MMSLSRKWCWLQVKDSVPERDADTKYSYLWNCCKELDPAVKIVLATDNDGPGNNLAEELARRLGRERCWRVRWPGAAVSVPCTYQPYSDHAHVD